MAKQRELEEKKRQQDIDDWENHREGKGYKNRANVGEDREREALRQQAAVKGKKGFKPGRILNYQLGISSMISTTTIGCLLYTSPRPRDS